MRQRFKKKKLINKSLIDTKVIKNMCKEDMLIIKVPSDIPVNLRERIFIQLKTLIKYIKNELGVKTIVIPDTLYIEKSSLDEIKTMRDELNVIIERFELK